MFVRVLGVYRESLVCIWGFWGCVGAYGVKVGGMGIV